MYWLLVASLLAAEPEVSGATRAPAPAPEPAQGGASAQPGRADAPSSAAPRPEPAAEKDAQKSQEEKRKLEEEIAKELGAQPSAGAGAAAGGAQPPQPQPPPSAPQQGQTGGNPLARLLLLPDISAIGRAALAWNQLDVESLSPRSDLFAPAHKVQPVLEEVEVALQAVVDPYARADVFLSFGSDRAEVEEAYLTTLTLPFSLQARGGQFFAPVGRINQQHGHVFDFVDRPLALARLLGADALKGPGVDVAWLAPTPWFAELRLAYQALTPGFLGASRNAGVGRLSQFFDVGEASTLGVGVSGALFDEPGAGASRHLLGGDAFLKIRPLRTRSYVAIQSEVVSRWLTAAPDAGGAPLAEPSGTAWGGYVQAVWRDGPYFAYGARYERAPAVSGGPEHRASALVVWLPSEFQRLRLQVSYDRLPGGNDGLEALLHLEFAIGAHGAHPF